jgi:hypothetical protein
MYALTYAFCHAYITIHNTHTHKTTQNYLDSLDLLPEHLVSLQRITSSLSLTSLATQGIIFLSVFLLLLTLLLLLELCELSLGVCQGSVLRLEPVNMYMYMYIYIYIYIYIYMPPQPVSAA